MASIREKLMVVFREHEGRGFTQAEVTGALDCRADRTSIYRALKSLEKMRFLHRVVNMDGETRYAYLQTCGAHAHFQCSRCGKVLCLPQVPCIFPAILEGFQPQQMHWLLKGRCPAC